MLSLVDAWIKAAVEHKTLRIRYFSARTKKGFTMRVVEPDFVGWSRDGRVSGLWRFCRLRRANRVFKPDSILRWYCVGETFSPNPRGRWRELIPFYAERKLTKQPWRASTEMLSIGPDVSNVL